MTANVVVGQISSGLVLVIVEMLRSVPAWLRVRRERNIEGLSAASTGVLAGSGVGWIAVAVLANSAAAAISTCVWLVFHFLLWREVVRVDDRVRRQIWMTAGATTFAIVGAGAAGAATGHARDVLGVTIGVISALYSYPALYVGMVSRSTAGLSVVSLSVNALEGAIYLVGGLGLGGVSPAGTIVIGYVLFGSIAISANFPRVVRTTWRRSRGMDASTEPSPLSQPIEGF